MKCSAIAIAALLATVSADSCEFVELDEPIEIDLNGMQSLMFVGASPTVLLRQIGEPKIRILRHTNSRPRALVSADTVMIGSQRCITDEMTKTLAPTSAPTTPASSASSYYTSVASFLSLSAGTYFLGASPEISMGFGIAAAAGNLFPRVSVS